MFPRRFFLLRRPATTVSFQSAPARLYHARLSLSGNLATRTRLNLVSKSFACSQASFSSHATRLGASREPSFQQGAPADRIYLGKLNDETRRLASEALQTSPGLINSHDLQRATRIPFTVLTFEDSAAAAEAFELLVSRFYNTGVLVQWSKQPKTDTLYVGEMEPEVREFVHEALKKLPGVAEDIQHVDSTGELRPWVHLKFTSEATAQNAYKQLVKEVGETKVFIDFARGPTSSSNESNRLNRPPSSTLVVGNLPVEASEEEVAASFRNLPGVVEVTIAGKDTLGTKQAHVIVRLQNTDFSSRALTEIREGRISIRGRRLWVNYERVEREHGRDELGAPARGLFIGNLPISTSKDDLRAVFEPYGAIRDAVVVLPAQKSKPAWGIVEFAELQDAEAALQACQSRPIFPGGSKMRISFRHPQVERKKQAQEVRSNTEPTRTLFVSGIDSATAEELYQLFAPYKPKATRIITDHVTGDKKGFGFVDFKTVQEAQVALTAINERDFGPRSRLRVLFSEHRETQKRSNSKKR